MGQIHTIGTTYKHKNGDFFILISITVCDEPDHAVLISLTDGGIWSDPVEANCEGNYISDSEFYEVACRKPDDFKKVDNPIRQARKRLAYIEKKLATEEIDISRVIMHDIQIELQEILDEREKSEDQE